MEIDVIYPDEENSIRDTPCLIAATYFSPRELIDFGLKPDAPEVNAPFEDDNEFEKVFKLWESPIYLRNFFKNNKDFFEQEYWEGITEDKFVHDVIKSLNKIREELLTLFRNHKFHCVVEPLSPEEENLRLHRSIRIKVKKGWIHGRLAFRFYAIEIEENKCYLITGAAIKIHKDMGKAPNTLIEINKLDFTLRELTAQKVDTKELFIDFIF